MLNTKQYIRTFLIFMTALLFASCNKVVIKIENVPENTPAGAPIFVSGNFNLWDAADRQYQLQIGKDSAYYIELPRMMGEIEYKFTRGDWSTVEKNRCGNELNNHIIIAKNQDTVYHVVESWADLDPINCDSVTIVVDEIPANTPEGGPLKIAGSFNAWNPGDNQDYFLRKDTIRNRYEVTVPRISQGGKANNLFTYKFIRENITIAEVDKFGREIDPRILNFEKGDSVFVVIDNWSDKVNPEMNHVIIILNSIPDYTPENDKIHLVGNFNNWNPGDNNYIFKPNEEGRLEIVLPREKYGLSFKITRGSWDTEFTEQCGLKLDNQNYNYDEIDTLMYNVEGWYDFPMKINPRVTLLVNRFPENTPTSANLEIKAHEMINGRDPKSFKLKKVSEGYACEIKRSDLNFGYIVTRGGYLSQEVDINGAFVSPRNLGNQCEDTVFIAVDKWNDLFDNDNLIKVVVSKIPKGTPKNDNIFIVGKFNGWNPGDENFKLTKERDGSFSISLNRRWLQYGFKFTRGNWRTVEANDDNDYIENRVIRTDKETINLEIEGWETLSLFN